MIRAETIRKSYGNLEVLKGIDIEIKSSEIISIVGASGAGKSTLLQILGTLDTMDSGKLFYENEDISRFNKSKMARFRNQHIGFVFQFHHLLPEFNALENVCIPAFINNVSRTEANKEGLRLLDMLGLSDRADHKPNELSGGEQQRVAVARALINKPKIIFADEPSGNLDSDNANDLHDLFFQLRDELKQAFVIVTHNNSLAESADRMMLMKDGVFIDG
jgi:lipoprotein-releasing system ATP-binding protein